MPMVGIEINQTSGSNNYLMNCKVVLPAMHLPMLDILLSTLIRRNNLTDGQVAELKAKQMEANWVREFHLSLSSVADLLYPSRKALQASETEGMTSKPCRDRKAFQRAAIASCEAILKSGCLLEEYRSEEGLFRVREDVAHYVLDTDLPSPIQVPVTLYRYRRLAGHALADHAFVANRRLMVDQKMNPKKWNPDREFDMDWFCRITGIPTLEQWRKGPSHKYVEGNREWWLECVTRSMEFYGLYQVCRVGGKVVVHNT